MDTIPALHGKGKPLSGSSAKLCYSRQSAGGSFLAMAMNYLKKPVLLGGIKAMVQVINGGCHVPWAAGYRPALGGWGHEMGTEMLALLQHTHVFLPLQEGIGAPGCHWTQQSGHRLCTIQRI